MREYVARGRYKKLNRRRALRASRVVGTGALHQSLRGSCHRPSGTDLSSAIMAAPAVATPATRASTTWSVYGRVAQTPHERLCASPWTQGLMHCLWMIAWHTHHMSLSVPVNQALAVHENWGP